MNLFFERSGEKHKLNIFYQSLGTWFILKWAPESNIGIIVTRAINNAKKKTVRIAFIYNISL